MDIVAGDDAYIKVTLTKSNLTFSIGLSAVVKASITDKNHQTILAGPVTVSNAETGSDWANSLIVVKMVEKLTSGIKASTPAVLEIQVSDTGIKTTWFANINVIKGLIK